MKVFHASTPKKRQEITIHCSEIYPDTYIAEFFTRGKSTGIASGYNQTEIKKLVADEIVDVSYYDDIVYEIELNDIGIPTCRQCGKHVTNETFCSDLCKREFEWESLHEARYC